MTDGDFASPGILILARGDDLALARAAVVRIGGRCQQAGDLPIAGCDAVLAIARDAAAVAALFARGDAGPCVLAVPFALVDLAWALAGERPVALLADADEADLAEALADLLAIGAVSPAVHDGDRPAELRRLSGEVARIARALAALSAASPPPAEAPLPTAAAIRAVLRARRLRDRFFDAAIFADPAWDMLLDLMAARIEARDVAVSSLCIAAAVPATTALRWIRGLTGAGTFLRVADPADARRAFVTLSDGAARAMAGYFAELEAQGLPGA